MRHPEPANDPFGYRQRSVNTPIATVSAARERDYRRCVLGLRLVGELAVERDGIPVPLSVTNRRILAFLALCPGLHNRDALSARFWPDAAQSSAHANLRTALWSLRQAVGPDAVHATRTSVGLHEPAWWIDLREIRNRSDVGDLAGAVELCRGDLLAGVLDDWASEARREHRERHTGMLDRLAQQAEAAGEPAEAARLSRLRCALTPFDEPAHRALLRRLGAAGDRAGALVASREFVDRLRTELGVRPGPATRAVLAEVRGPVTSGADTARRQAPLFGRAAELRRLVEAWTAARDGAARVVVITGEAGIGKTRLIGELAGRASSSGARVAVGSGVDVGGEAPLALWQELAHELVRSLPSPPQQASWPAELGRLSPSLALALGHLGGPAPVAAPELERLRIFDAMLRLVEWAAASRPVLLVAEDIHRADRASLQLCAHIGRRLAALPVLFVLSRRDRPARPDADALLADLAGRGVDVGEIELGQLTAAELAAIVTSVAPLPHDDVQRVVTAAEGSPLLAVESARAVAAGSTAPPSSLRAAVRAAIGVLPRTAQELAEDLAVAGRELTAGEIAALELPDCAEAERQVLNTGLIRRVGRGLKFQHALLAEAARADLRDPQPHYERVALAIEAAGGSDGLDTKAAEVARALSRAGRDDLAGPRWRRAAAHARSLGALPEAVDFWLEAVRCAPEDPAPRLELAEVHAWLGRREDFERCWQEALDRTPPEDQSATWCRRGNVMRSVLCHPSASFTAYQQALALLSDDAPAAARAEVLLGVAGTEAVAGDPSRSGPLLEQVALLAPEPDVVTTAEIEWVRLAWLVRIGRFDELEDAAEKATQAFQDAELPSIAFAGLIIATCGLAAGDDVDAALRTADRALALTRGVPTLTLPCLAARAHLLSRLGRHDEALVAARDQLAMAERLDSPALVALAQNDAGLVTLAAGLFNEAAQLLAAALAGEAKVSRPATRLARAEALARAGHPDDATTELRQAALEPVGTGDQPWALVPQMSRVQGLIALARGDLVESRRRLSEAVAGWQRRRPPDPGEELMANLVDLARPPVVGLVEPARELDRVSAELAEIAGVS
jgi:DNA-binding SARP family transcriptional activator/tetratricopeptide (TPR) repeat protein